MRRDVVFVVVATFLLVPLAALVGRRGAGEDAVRPTAPGRPSGARGPSGVSTAERSRSSTRPARRSRVRVTFDAPRPTAGAPRRLMSTGTARVDVEVVTLDGGRAVVTPVGEDRALRLPSFRPGDATPPRAAVRITNATQVDQLDPGTRPFAFGATVRLFAASEGRRLVDNGNNLMQRGLATEPSQYKIELDGRVPTCRVKGRAGEVTAYSPVVLNARDWYTIVCRRAGPEVTLTVTRHSPGGDERPRPADRVSAFGIIGSVHAGSPGTPLSVGGKLYPTGRMNGSATDQLNGLVADAFLEVG